MVPYMDIFGINLHQHVIFDAKYNASSDVYHEQTVVILVLVIVLWIRQKDDNRVVIIPYL